MENSFRLRGVPLQDLSEKAVKDLMKQKGFYHQVWNPRGIGIHNDFQELHGRSVILDRAAGLLWQQSGSAGRMGFEEAALYIEELNRKQFGGFSNWHLPTLEEAMSLVTPARNRDKLFVSPLFDTRQSQIWTADRCCASEVWVLGFADGGCDYCPMIKKHYIRAVCAV